MVSTPAHTTRAWRFGLFEVDANNGVLRRAGITLKLRDQAFRILVLLLEHAGDLVTREDLRKALWSTDTYVDFDHSLNSAIMRLREALGDTADKPIYVETVPRRGYRFIAPLIPARETPPAANLSGVPGADAMAETAAMASEPFAGPWPRTLLRVGPRLIIGGAILVIAMVAAIWYLRRPLRPPRITDFVRLTLDGRRKDAIGTDGTSVFLNLESPSGMGQVPVSGGKIDLIVPELPGGFRFKGFGPWMWAVSPDGASLLVQGDSGPASDYGVWIVGTSGRPARFLTKDAWNATWSPDGKQIVYATAQGDLYVLPSEGGKPRLLSASKGKPLGWPGDLAWSPDGTKIRFTRDFTIWEVAADGSSPHQLIPGWGDSHFSCSGRWTPDGKYFLFLSSSAAIYGPFSLTAQIWAIDERRSPLGQSNPLPFQLSTGPMRWGAPIPSRDGKLVFARGSDLRGELERFDKESKHFKPYLGGISAEFVRFSNDGKYVAYVSFPDGILWRGNSDGTGIIQLTQPPMYPVNPRWSPDDTQIVFFDYALEHKNSIYVVPSRGGALQQLTPGEKEPVSSPDWSPDGKRIVFDAGYTGDSINHTEIRILDLEKHTTITLPDWPGHLYSPRWSPDGRYIFALSLAQTELVQFDLQAKHWSVTLRGTYLGWPQFSRDGRFIYVKGLSSGLTGVLRVPTTGGKPELVASEPGFRSTGLWSGWFGLDPDDVPIALRDQGTDEIYALTLER